MDIQNWIMAQMGIDLIIVCILLWFIKLNMKGKRPDNELDEKLLKAERTLTQIRELSQNMEKSLGEKQRQGRSMLEQLDESVERAEEIFERVKNTAKDIGANPERSKNVPKNSEQMRSSVKALLAKGLPRKEIAQHLGMSVDEIDLLIKLKMPSSH